MFVEGWVRVNVHFIGFDAADDTKAAKQYASECAAAASQAGIDAFEIERHLGNLIAHMAAQIKRVNDREGSRLAATMGPSSST
jgi:hypothetical protein